MRSICWLFKIKVNILVKGYSWTGRYYKGSNLIGYRVPGGFWVDFFHKKPLIQP